MEYLHDHRLIATAVFMLVTTVGLICLFGSFCLLDSFFDWLSRKTYEFRRQLADKWRTRHMPKLVVWENLGVTAVARRDDYRRAVKTSPDVKYPIIPKTVTFSDPYTTYGEILTRTQPRYFTRVGFSGTINDLKVLLGNCVVERRPMFVPFTSFAVMNKEQQLRIFRQFGSADEACRYLLRKRK